MFIFKVIVSALLIAGISELGKRSTMLAAILASLPLISIVSLSWLYIETGSVQKASELSTGIFWAVLPSLLFFVVFPVLLKLNVNFWIALTGSCVVMFGGYWGYTKLLSRFGIS